jgi:hypothetical protein
MPDPLDLDSLQYDLELAVHDLSDTLASGRGVGHEDLYRRLRGLAEQALVVHVACDRRELDAGRAKAALVAV